MRTRVLKVDANRPDPDAVRQAGGLLRRGGLVAFPTETVYGLGANWEDPEALQELYRVKHRPFEKQVTLHVAGMEDLQRHSVVIPPLGKALMERFWPGPVTLIFRRDDGSSTVGFRMPSLPVARAFLKEAAVPVVAPSANRTGNPPPRTAGEVLRDLSDEIDLVLDAGPTPLGQESTIVDVTSRPARILRRGAMADEVERALFPG